MGWGSFVKSIKKAVKQVAPFVFPALAVTAKIVSKVFAPPKVSTSSYEETSTKEVDLRYAMSSSHIPIIYGVRQIGLNPIFTDTLLNNPSELYVIYTVCEGGIEGFLDVYISDAPATCWNSADAENRTCTGSKKTSGGTINGTSVMSEGVPYTIDDGTRKVEVTAYYGNGANRLIAIENIAKANGFYLQNNPAEGGGVTPAQEYWGSNHTLTDTAVLVCKYTITAESPDVPALLLDVAGKKVPSYDALGLNKTNHSNSLTNPAWQFLDYLTSPIYGGAVPIEDVDIPSFHKVAVLCDTLDESYQSSWVPYWRYLGWPNNSSSNRKLLQTNMEIDTSTTVYKNIEGILNQIGASLTIVGGKYTLSLLEDVPPTLDIHIDDTVIGGFTLSDSSLGTKFNSVQASIKDPGKQWGTNSIVFHNSVFVAEDSNVIKKGSLSFPYITNYYTARALAEKQLNVSRSTKAIGFTLPFKYVGLSVNEHITLTHPRYFWDKKRFIISEITWSKDHKLTVVAGEYVPGMFLVSSKNEVPISDSTPVSFIRPPTELLYDVYTGTLGGISGTLSWLPSSSPDLSHYLVTGFANGTDRSLLVNPEDPLSKRIGLELTDVVGLQTYKVYAVTYSGLKSKAVEITTPVLSPRVLPPIENLRLVNAVQGSTRVWGGGDMEIAWDENPAINSHEGVVYNVVVGDNNEYVLLNTTTSELASTYTLAQNKAKHLQNTGNPGVYRQLTVKVRAVSSDGALSTWSNL